MNLSKNFKDSIALRIETIEMMHLVFVTKEACRIIIVKRGEGWIEMKCKEQLAEKRFVTKILSEELLK